jgi:hypothetical protein
MKPLIVDLSIDFDFFVCYPVEYDNTGLGEPDHARSAALWRQRERDGWDLRRVGDPTDADFDPVEIVQEFEDDGLDFTAVRDVGVADSHVQAHHFFAKRWKRDGEPDELRNVDAHHDIERLDEAENYLAGVLDCANWVRHLALTAPRVQIEQVFPGWLLRKYCTASPSDLPNWRWRQWPELPAFARPCFVRHIFLCLSSPWTPPHLYRTFHAMAAALEAAAGPRTLTLMEKLPLASHD